MMYYYPSSLPDTKRAADKKISVDCTCSASVTAKKEENECADDINVNTKTRSYLARTMTR